MSLVTSSSLVERVGCEAQEVLRLRARPRLLQGVPYLAQRDRALLEMSLKHGMSRRQMGMVLGLTAGTITRRLRNLTNRLSQPIVLSLTDPRCTLAGDLRQIGIEYFLHRLPQPEIARRHQMSRYELMKQIEQIRGWALRER